MGRQIKKVTKIVDNATVAVSTTNNSAPVNVRGAMAVYFILTASNAQAPSSTSITFSDDGTNWVTSGIQVSSTAINSALNTGGKWMYSVPIDNAVGVASPMIAHKFARLNLTNGAASSITGYTVDAWVCYDGDTSYVVGDTETGPS